MKVKAHHRKGKGVFLYDEGKRVGSLDLWIARKLLLNVPKQGETVEIDIGSFTAEGLLRELRHEHSRRMQTLTARDQIAMAVFSSTPEDHSLESRVIGAYEIAELFLAQKDR